MAQPPLTPFERSWKTLLTAFQTPYLSETIRGKWMWRMRRIVWGLIREGNIVDNKEQNELHQFTLRFAVFYAMKWRSLSRKVTLFAIQNDIYYFADDLSLCRSPCISFAQSVNSLILKAVPSSSTSYDNKSQFFTIHQSKSKRASFQTHWNNSTSLPL